MTISYVGAGTAATAVNAQVIPVVHADTAVGDLVLVFLSVRNSGAGTVNDKPGWTRIAGTANAAVLGKIWQTGDTAVGSFTFSGSVANADTIGQPLTYRGVEPRLPDAIAVTAEQLNSSAQNADYPALDVPADDHLAILFVWKQDDNTGAGTPSGFTAVLNTSTATGDDASQILRHAIQTTEADLPAGTLTVTGGGSAISRAIVFAVRPAAALVVTEQDVYPPRVVIAVSGLTVGDQLDVYREVAGVRILVRGGHVDAVTDPGFVVVDAELPFGTPVRHVAVVNGTVEYAGDPVTYTLPGGTVVLSDAITGAAAEVVIMGADPLVRSRASARFNVGGRNLMVSGPLGQPEGRYELFVETTTARDNLFTLLETATEGIVQIRQPLTGVYDGVDAYLAVDKVTETRWSQDGSDQRRLVAVDFAEVDGWADTLTARGFSYGEVEAYYAGISYASAAGDYPTYLDALQGDFS